VTRGSGEKDTLKRKNTKEPRTSKGENKELQNKSKKRDEQKSKRMRRIQN